MDGGRSIGTRVSPGGIHDACTSCKARVGTFSCSSILQDGAYASATRSRASTLGLHRSSRLPSVQRGVVAAALHSGLDQQRPRAASREPAASIVIQTPLPNCCSRESAHESRLELTLRCRFHWLKVSLLPLSSPRSLTFAKHSQQPPRRIRDSTTQQWRE